jgi:hypothetical protein
VKKPASRHHRQKGKESMREYQGDPNNPPCSTANPREFSSGQPGANGVPFTALVGGFQVTIEDGSTVMLDAGDVILCRGAAPSAVTPVNHKNGTPKAHTPVSELDPAIPGFGFRGFIPGQPCFFSKFSREDGSWGSVDFPPADGSAVKPEPIAPAAERALVGAARLFVLGAISTADLEQAALTYAASVGKR